MRLDLEVNPPTGRTALCLAVRWLLIGAGSTAVIGGSALDHDTLCNVGYVMLLLGIMCVIAARCTVNDRVIRDAEGRGYDIGYREGRLAEREELTERSAVLGSGGVVVPFDRAAQQLAE